MCLCTLLKAHPGRFQAIWAYFLSTQTTEHASPLLLLVWYLFFSPLSVSARLVPTIFSPPFLHTGEMGFFSFWGSCGGQTSLEDSKFVFHFNRLVWRKFEGTYSQPGDIQYDNKAGSYLISSCINTDWEEESLWLLMQKKWHIVYCCLYFSLVFIYNTTSLYFPTAQREMYG